MTYEEWVEKYRPIKNDISPGQGYDDTLFETYGDDLTHVRKTWEKTPNRIWTLLDADGSTVIGDGYHWVNRIGYFITEHDYAGPGLEIIIDEPGDEDDDRCLTEDCDEDPNDGEGFDGYCGNCADRRERAGCNEDGA